MNASGRPLIFIPTYNEKDNVERILSEITGLNLGTDVLFLDDNSPDGTGKLLDRMASGNPTVRIIHRPGKAGIGSAHQAGIARAYDEGRRILITMDCDFTHPTKYIPDFLAQAERAEVAVGTRFVRADSLADWDPVRLVLTHMAHHLTKVMLDMPYDATGAFRLYRLDRIPREIWGLVRSVGYSFFIESLFVLHRNRFPILEVPITLPARTKGHSKMTVRDAFRTAGRLWELQLEAKRDPARFRLGGRHA